MPFKPSVKGCFSFFVLAGLIAVAVFYLAVPIFVEKLVIQKARQIPGLEQFSFHVRHIGFFGLDVGGLTTGQGPLIDSVHFSYSPESLFKRRLKAIEISGLDLRGKVTPSGITINDFPFKQDKNPQSPAGNELHETAIEAAIGKIFPLLPETINIRNSIVSIALDSGSIRVPLDLSLAVKQKEKRILLLMKIFPYGETLEAAITATAETGIDVIELKADGFGLTHLQGLVDLVAPGILLKGKTDLLLSKTRDRQWNLNLSALDVGNPMDNSMDFRVKNLDCRLATLSPFSVSGSFSVDNSLVKDLSVNFTGGIGPGSKWRLKTGIGVAKPDNYEISLNGETAAIINPDLSILAQGNGNVGKFEFSGKIDQCRGKINNPSGFVSGSISGITLKGRGNFDLKGKQDLIDMSFTAESGPVSLVGHDFFVKAPAVSIPGLLILDSKYAPRVMFTPTVKGAEAGSSPYKVAAKDISFKLPFFLPLKDEVDTGKFTVASLTHDKQKFGQIQGSTNQTPGGVQIRGNLDVSAKIPELDVSFIVDFLAILGFEKKQPRCSFEINLTRGRISSKEKHLEANGISATLGSDDLFAMHSKPGQVVKVDSLGVNDIHITDVGLRYTIESMESLLVENLEFGWCEGRITTESMRIQTSKKEYNLTLFCDRLKLSEILRQVGSFQAQGDGALNGRIPVSFSNGNVSFDKGFLFSTPGGGGKISIRGADMLLAGVPKDSAQYTQIDLAREALKDYQYKWAKLLFNTKGETLFVNMEFDGEPENRLPFVYKKEIGGFARVDASSPGSKFQGIKIDVNLELPFNRVMKFGTIFNKMIK